MHLDSPRDEFRGFATLAAGQIISILGSELTYFSLGVWVFQQTGSVTRFALVAMSVSITSTLLAPVVGSLVDGWDRHRLMAGASLLGLLTNLGLVLLVSLGQLAFGPIILATVLTAVLRSVQSSVLSATMPLLVPERHLGRASSLLLLGDGAAQVVGPGVAGLMLGVLQLSGVLLLDCATFGVTLLMLLRVHLPRTAPAGDPQRVRGSFWGEVAAGWTYVARYTGLLWVLGFFCLVNAMIALAAVLVPPFVLKQASPAALGAVTSVAGLGMLTGSLLMMVWGGPQRRRLAGIAFFGVLFGLSYLMTGLTQSLPLLAVCGFFIFFFLTLLTSTVQAFWASRVAPELQGRVYAVRMVVSWTSTSLAYPAAGPLTDGWLEPLLAGGGPWARRLGALVGTGPGRGIAVLFVAVGTLCVLSALVLYLPRFVRRLDTEGGSGGLHGAGTSFTS